jgi:non-heme chloroperoxidase
MHGEDDQIVPIDISGRKSAKLIKGAKEIFLSRIAAWPHRDARRSS